MDAHAGSPPHHILGYPLRSHTRIFVSYLIPSALELFVYIGQIVADCAVGYEHFHNHQPGFGWGTLVLIFVPPLLTFILVMSSKVQWANPKYKSRSDFVTHHLLQLFLFPFFAIYRFMVRVFWSVEALFHDDDDTERMRCLAKAEECSTCELYHLIQAYGQAAPQIILQLYHLLTQDLFRDFQTTNAQAICLVFAAIDLAAITTAYQCFESQHQAGRHYPWSTPQEVAEHRKLLEQDKCLREECERKARYSQRTITSFPESDKIMEKFKRAHSLDSEEFNEQGVTTAQTHAVQVHARDEVDNDTKNETTTSSQLSPENEDFTKDEEITKLLAKPSLPAMRNATDDDKIRTGPRIRLPSIREEMRNLDSIEVVDTVPDSPAPLPPPLTQPSSPTGSELPQLRKQSITSENSSTRNKRTSKTISQLETFKDMLIINAQLYIKDHVPHPPKAFIKRVEAMDQEQLLKSRTSTTISPPNSPGTPPQDVVDFFLPRPTKVVNGIQQDDFAGKTVAFFGWIAFIIMRMLSLATFCIFFPQAFFIIISVHYVLMLAALFLETRFKGNWNRVLFYITLAYIFIFVILEFRVKFKRIRLWFVGYFLVTMGENIGMTISWYASAEFESWWFGFIFQCIIYSGILFVATLFVYYCILKPKDVALLVEDNAQNVHQIQHSDN